MDAELGEKAARLLSRPREEQGSLGPGQADVEQPAFLGDRLVRLRLLEGQLALGQEREEDGLELEPLGAVVGEELDAASLALRAEAGLEVGEEVRDRRLLRERGCQGNQPPEVLLERHALVAEPVRDRLVKPAETAASRTFSAAGPATARRSRRRRARARGPLEEGAAANLVRDTR